MASWHDVLCVRGIFPVLSQSLVLDQARRQSAHTSEKQGTMWPANLSAKEKHKIASVQTRLGPQLEVEECMASRRARIPAGASALLIIIEGRYPDGSLIGLPVEPSKSLSESRNDATGAPTWS